MCWCMRLCVHTCMCLSTVINILELILWPRTCVRGTTQLQALTREPSRGNASHPSTTGRTTEGGDTEFCYCCREEFEFESWNYINLQEKIPNTEEKQTLDKHWAARSINETRTLLKVAAKTAIAPCSTLKRALLQTHHSTKPERP